MVLAMRDSHATRVPDFLEEAQAAKAGLDSSRPTAVNLMWATGRVFAKISAMRGGAVAVLKQTMLDEAIAIWHEDIAMCQAMGEHGATLISDGQTWLTHCNAGALATAGIGTALSAIYVAHRQGKRIHVYSDETRPLLQGARLTAWELQRAGVPVTVITDSMAATVMAQGRIDGVIVGADRVCANGDFANKIGTLGVAVLAREFGVPFYVVAPSSTIDMALPDGTHIPIEERKAEEVTHGFGRRTAPEGVAVYNPAFDVTPHRYLSGIVTERGIIRAPFAPGLRALV